MWLAWCMICYQVAYECCHCTWTGCGVYALKNTIILWWMCGTSIIPTFDHQLVRIHFVCVEREGGKLHCWKNWAETENWRYSKKNAYVFHLRTQILVENALYNFISQKDNLAFPLLYTKHVDKTYRVVTEFYLILTMCCKLFSTQLYKLIISYQHS